MEKALAVAFVGGVPVIPRTIEGRQVSLGDYSSFIVSSPGGGFSIIPADDFLETFCPTRKLFRDAGHG